MSWTKIRTKFREDRLNNSQLEVDFHVLKCMRVPVFVFHVLKLNVPKGVTVATLNVPKGVTVATLNVPKGVTVATLNVPKGVIVATLNVPKGVTVATLNVPVFEYQERCARASLHIFAF